MPFISANIKSAVNFLLILSRLKYTKDYSNKEIVLKKLFTARIFTMKIRAKIASTASKKL